jgi:outer membrane protein TolC
MQDMALAEVRLAEAAKRPDWSLEVAYAQRGPAYSNMVTIGVRVDLPIFEGRRQNPAIASKLAAAEQIRSQAEDARRAHLTEVRVMLADWRAAQLRVRRIESAQIPLAKGRTEMLLAAYGGGRGELGAVLESRRMEIETRIALVQATTEMGRAWAQLNFLLPLDSHKDIK